ncbi:MAG: ABC transporter ATP-binding protein [Bacteroidia bacterium]|nr:ABC transporter ATP-binding protein [Bacteroidia bacterium]
MIKFQDILKLAKPYRPQLYKFLSFNILTSIFNVVSIGMVIPFLKVIFRKNPEIIPTEFSYNPVEFISFLDYKISLVIQDLGQFDALIYFSGGIIIAFFLKNISLYFSFFNLAFVRSAVVRDIRERIYNHILKLPLNYFNKEKRGDTLSRFTNDVKEVEWSLLGVIELYFKHPVAIMIPLVSLFVISYQLTFFVLIVLPISGYLISRVGKRLKNAAQAGQEKMAEVLSHLEESLHGIKIIKAFGAGKNKEERFKALNDDHFIQMVKLHRKEFLASPLSEFMASLVMSAILVFSGYLILKTDSPLQPEFLIGYIAMFSQLIPPAKAISEAFFRLKKGAASLDRINEILAAEVEKDRSGLPAPVFASTIKLNDVSFAYGDGPLVLKNISLTINKGDTVALVGSSGGGKSTLADLIPRFHELGSGTITIDGQDISKMELNSLRAMMGIVTQDAILFNDTAANNIKMGDFYLSGDQLINAAKVANAHEFVRELPESYNTNLGEKGMNLSGGQRQRMSIARAVAKEPPILILDEATSALDTESEKMVQEALEKVMQNRTSIVIAHRLSTIQNAHKIVVLDKGEIAEEGTHTELIAKGGIYKKLVDLQTFE